MAPNSGKTRKQKLVRAVLEEARPAKRSAHEAHGPTSEQSKRSHKPGVQTHGPPMRTVSGRMSLNYGSPENDEWQTCAQTWASLAPAIERFRTSRIWMPFYYDGACAAHLRALGFENVIHEEGADFFERAKDAAFLSTVDVVIDNRAPSFISALQARASRSAFRMPLTKLAARPALAL